MHKNSGEIHTHDTPDIHTAAADSAVEAAASGTDDHYLQAEPNDGRDPTDAAAADVEFDPALADNREAEQPLTIDRLHDAYPTYADGVAALKRNPAKAVMLGAGNFKNVYRLPGFEGLAAKLYRTDGFRPRDEQQRGEEELLTRVSGYDNFEKARASSPTDHVMIIKEIDALPIEKADADMFDSLTSDMLRTAVEQAEAVAVEQDVPLDRAKGNILLGRVGLHFIDPLVRDSDGDTYADMREWNMLAIFEATARAGYATEQGISIEERLAVMNKLLTIMPMDSLRFGNRLSRLFRNVKEGYYKGYYIP